MKKLLSILGSLGMTAVAGAGVVACGTTKKAELPVKAAKGAETLAKLMPKAATKSYKELVTIPASEWNDSYIKAMKDGKNINQMILSSFASDGETQKQIDDEIVAMLPAIFRDNTSIDNHAKVMIADFFSRVEGTLMGSAWVNDSNNPELDTFGYSISQLQKLHDNCKFKPEIGECQKTLGNVLEVAHELKDQRDAKGDAYKYESFATVTESFDKLFTMNSDQLTKIANESRDWLNSNNINQEEIRNNSKNWLNKDASFRNETYSKIGMLLASDMINYGLKGNDDYDTMWNDLYWDFDPMDVEINHDNILLDNSVAELYGNLTLSGKLNQR